MRRAACTKEQFWTRRIARKVALSLFNRGKTRHLLAPVWCTACRHFHLEQSK